jgi:hypothetical protein
MAIGATTTNGDQVSIELLASATATNGVPSGDSAGLSAQDILAAFGGVMPPVLSLSLTSTAGSATMTVTARVWVQLNGAAATKVWVPYGPGTAAFKGMLNDGAPINETSADLLRHVERLPLPGHFLRIYLEITAIGGTSTAVTGLLHGWKNYTRADAADTEGLAPVWALVPDTSQVATVSGSSVKVTNAMVAGRWYRLSTTTDIWFNVGATGGSAAAATANNHFLASGREFYLRTHDATNYGFVHAIQASAGGTVSLTLMERG